jgi:ATP-dependent DNA helicase UvrD/PcrA
MNKYLEDLNPEQREAVTANEGFIKVLAGPGTGKTHTLITRLIHLVKTGVDPERILCITFTNKAMQTMKDRFDREFEEAMRTKIETFHGLCHRLLRYHIHLLGFPSQFCTLGNDQKSLLREIYSDLGLAVSEYPLDQMQKFISDMKVATDYYPEMMELQPVSLKEKVASIVDPYEKVYWHYLYRQRRNWTLDFDDLIYFTLELFKREPHILEKVQNKFEFIQCDEFQDVCPAQLELLKLLSHKHGNLFVVGDPDQTVYSWRGADIDFFINFEHHFPNARTIILKDNYRSVSSIVNAANALIKNNENRIEKELVPMRHQAGRVTHCPCRDSYDQARYVAETIMKLRKETNSRLSDFAIIYRSNYMSRKLEEKLLEFRIPYCIVKGQEFYGRKEIMDTLAFLKLVVYGDDISFLRIINTPRRDIGLVKKQKLKDYAAEHGVSLFQALRECCRTHKNFNHPKIKQFVGMIRHYQKVYKFRGTTELLKDLLWKSGYEAMLIRDPDSDRIENVRELIRSVGWLEQQAGGEIPASEFLAEVALYSSLVEKQEVDAVKLMTAHSAKGLEFSNVIVCGMNEGKFPSGKTNSADAMEEERRLAFVAFTRAKDNLVLASSDIDDFNKDHLPVSRFISEVSNDLIRKIKRIPKYF